MFIPNRVCGFQCFPKTTTDRNPIIFLRCCSEKLTTDNVGVSFVLDLLNHCILVGGMRRQVPITDVIYDTNDFFIFFSRLLSSIINNLLANAALNH